MFWKIAVLLLTTIWLFSDYSFALSKKTAEKSEKTKKLEKLICNTYINRNIVGLLRLVDTYKNTLSKIKSSDNCFNRALAIYYYEKGNYEKAVRYINKVSMFSKEDIINLSAFYIEDKNYKAAKELLQKAVITYEDDYRLFYNLAIASLRLKQKQQARKYFIKVISLNAPSEVKEKVIKILSFIGY